MLTMRDLEDIAISRNLRDAAELRQEARDMQDLTIALKTKNNQLSQLKAQLNEVAHERNETAYANSSAARALRDACQVIAELSGLPLEQVLQRFARENRTRHYNQLINSSLKEGKLLRDPREHGGEARERDWYVPDL